MATFFIRPDELQQRNGRETGVSIWTVGLQEMGFYEEGPDFRKVDDTLGHYLAANPEAWIILTFTMDTRYQNWWINKHPEKQDLI